MAVGVHLTGNQEMRKKAKGDGGRVRDDGKPSRTHRNEGRNE